MTTTQQRPAFVCWIEHQGRSGDLAELLGAELWLIGSPATALDRPAFAPIRWVDAAIRTIWRTIRSRPSAFIVMQPPVFALAIIMLLRRGRPVVADFHHDPFEERKWRWSLRWSLWLARRATLSVVTNTDHAEQIRAAGGAVAVLHDAPLPADPAAGDQPEHGHVLVPSSYSPDEPVAEMLEAARRLPDVTFMFTGRAPEDVIASAPGNVTFIGFVTDAEYHEALTTCVAVLCLTDKPNTMQRGGYEALSVQRPLITADSDVLRDYFGDAATFAAPRDPASIATAVSECLATASDRHRLMAKRHAHILADYPTQLQPITKALAIDA